MELKRFSGQFRSAEMPPLRGVLLTKLLSGVARTHGEAPSCCRAHGRGTPTEMHRAWKRMLHLHGVAAVGSKGQCQGTEDSNGRLFVFSSL